MKRRALCLLLGLAALLCLGLAHAEGSLDMDALMREIDAEALFGKELTVGPLTYEISPDRQSIFINRPEISSSTPYTIAYNIYDDRGNPVNYFYSTEKKVAATPGYGGRFNVFVVVTSTEAQRTQNIGWVDLDWPHADHLVVGKADFTVSEDKLSVFIDRPEIACKSGQITIAYNIYDSQSNPVNYFYSTEKRVAATPGYSGKFNVFIVVTDTVTGEQDIQNIGWQLLGGEELTWPVSVDGVLYDIREGVLSAVGCEPGLKTLQLKASVRGLPLKAIAPGAFSEKSISGKLTLPDSVTQVGAFAFYFCTGLTGTPKLGSGLKEIGDDAFCGCENLNGKLTLPSGLTYLGEGAFSGCSRLTGTLAIPKGIKKIGDQAFLNCEGLTGLSLTESLTAIGEAAFAGCTGLAGELELPGSLTNIGPSAFAGCKGLSGTLRLPGKLKVVSEGCFIQCTGLSGLWIPLTVQTISGSAFEGCSGLKALDLPVRLMAIGPYAFSACTGLTGTLTLPNGLRKIEECAFLNCRGLTGSLSVPGSVDAVGPMAFAGCTGLNGSLTLGEGIYTIGKEAFLGCTGLRGKLILPDSLTAIGDRAFANTGFSGTVHVPAGCTLGTDVFANTPVTLV